MASNAEMFPFDDVIMVILESWELINVKPLSGPMQACFSIQPFGNTFKWNVKRIQQFSSLHLKISSAYLFHNLTVTSHISFIEIFHHLYWIWQWPAKVIYICIFLIFRLPKHKCSTSDSHWGESYYESNISQTYAIENQYDGITHKVNKSEYLNGVFKISEEPVPIKTNENVGELNTGNVSVVWFEKQRHIGNCRDTVRPPLVVSDDKQWDCVLIS